MKKIKEIFQRKLRQVWDSDHITNVIYNEATGAQMNIEVEPAILNTYVANTQLEFGAYVKLNAGATSYDVDCIGKAYDSTYKNYRRGDLVTENNSIYIANQDFISGIAAGTFDADKWTKVAPKTISGIPAKGGALICIGKYHNAINQNGFTIDETSFYSKME